MLKTDYFTIVYYMIIVAVLAGSAVNVPAGSPATFRKSETAAQTIKAQHTYFPKPPVYTFTPHIEPPIEAHTDAYVPNPINDDNT